MDGRALPAALLRRWRQYHSPDRRSCSALPYRKTGARTRRATACRAVGAGNHLRDQRGRMLPSRSEEHTSELQSRPHLVCRLLLEKKKKKNTYKINLRKIQQY